MFFASLFTPVLRFLLLCTLGLCFLQGDFRRHRCLAGHGNPPCSRHVTKVWTPARESKLRRCLWSVWPLQLCYRGVVCHGAKWQRWHLMNPEGTMEEFMLLRERKAVATRCEAICFRERLGCTTSGVPPRLFQETFMWIFRPCNWRSKGVHLRHRTQLGTPSGTCPNLCERGPRTTSL